MVAKIDNIHRTYKPSDNLVEILKDIFDLILSRANKDIEYNDKIA